MAPPPLDSIHAPAGIARSDEREEKDDEPREIRDHDPHPRNQGTERQLRGGAEEEPLDRVSHFRARHAWLTLAPHNKITGGRLLSSATLPSANRAAGILRMAAMSLGRIETALGAFYRRMAFRVGKAKAITATARKLAILVYRPLKDGLVYRDPGAAAYDAQHRQRVIRRLRQRAANLGFALVNRQTGELVLSENSSHVRAQAARW